MCNARLYRFWGDLTEALQSGKPQNEVKRSGKPLFDELYSDQARLEQFMLAMQGTSLGNFQALAEKFDFSGYSTVCDAGEPPANCARFSPIAIRIFGARALTFRPSRRSPRGPSQPRVWPTEW
jgi:hypothetical protein